MFCVRPLTSLIINEHKRNVKDFFQDFLSLVEFSTSNRDNEIMLVRVRVG